MLAVSPAELRRRWAYRVGDVTATGQLLRESVGAVEVLERAEEVSEFEHVRERTATDPEAGPGHVASGIGLALGWHGAGFTGGGEKRLASAAGIELATDGRIRVLTSSTEMGQGTRTILPQLVAEALDVPYEVVDLAPQDTSLVPDSGPTVASRTAMVIGGLLVEAARRLRAEVEEQTGRPFADAYRGFAAAHGPVRMYEQFGGYPDI